MVSTHNPEGGMDRKAFLGALVLMPAAAVSRADEVEPEVETPEPRPIRIVTIIETGDIDVERIERALIDRAGR